MSSSRLIAISNPQGQWLAVQIPLDGPEPEPEPVKVERLPAKVEAEPRQVAAVDDVERVAELLARAVKIAQRMSASDARRVRAIFQAASGALTATTMLDDGDQAKFNQAVRNARD